MRIPVCLFLLIASVGAELSEQDRKQAVRRGLAYLDGHLFRLPEIQGTPREPFTYSIAGLCFLLQHETRAGASPVQRIRKTLARYVDRVAERSKDPPSLPPRHGFASSRYLIQYTWPISAAGLFFLELEQRGRKSPRVLRRILAILADAQEGNGGWGHGRINPKNKVPSLLEGMPDGYPNTLVSASNCVAMTIGLLTAAGYPAGDAVERARRYYRAARLDNGSFPYDPSQRSSGFAKTNVGRTAGSIFAMHSLGMARDRAFSGSVKYLLDHLAWVSEGHGSPCLNMMHGALCCRMLGRDAWMRFRREFEPRILQAQDESGHLACICEQKAFGVTCDTKGLLGGLGGVFRESKRCYTTALHTFVLLLESADLKLLKLRKPGPAITPKRRRR